MPRLKKGEREIISNRNAFTQWGAATDIEEKVAGNRFEYALAGAPFAVMEWRDDRVYFEVLVAKSELARITAFESPRMSFAAMKKGWYSIEIGTNVKDHLEAGIGALIGAIQRELRGA